MKKVLVLTIISLLSVIPKVKAQQEEIQQLLLNVEKLAQFKKILSDMKKGYEIISSGYNTVKDISQGTFDLHRTFFDGLLKVSPAVRSYKKVADIIANQVKIVKEYKAAINRFKRDKNFNSGEIHYLTKVYSQLFNESLEDLDELTLIVTDSKLRMSDDERISSIDRVYENMQDKLLFLRHFNNQATILAVQRARDKNDVLTMKTIYGINN